MKRRLESAQNQFYIVPWSERFARAQWRFALHLQSLNSESWARNITLFSSQFINDPAAEYEPHRIQGRPHMRWDDYISKFCRLHWPEFETDHWIEVLGKVNAAENEDAFVSFVI